MFQLQAIGIVSGHVTVDLFGPTNAVVVIQAATNLSNPQWIPISTNTLSSAGTGIFEDGPSTNYAHRFYRIKY